MYTTLDNLQNGKPLQLLAAGLNELSNVKKFPASAKRKLQDNVDISIKDTGKRLKTETPSPVVNHERNVNHNGEESNLISSDIKNGLPPKTKSVAPRDMLSSCDVLPVEGDRYILDICLDFFSVKNPFKDDYTEVSA